MCLFLMTGWSIFPNNWDVQFWICRFLNDIWNGPVLIISKNMWHQFLVGITGELTCHRISNLGRSKNYWLIESLSMNVIFFMTSMEFLLDCYQTKNSLHPYNLHHKIEWAWIFFSDDFLFFFKNLCYFESKFVGSSYSIYPALFLCGLGGGLGG